jgi:hypothetical protein
MSWPLLIDLFAAMNQSLCFFLPDFNVKRNFVLIQYRDHFQRVASDREALGALRVVYYFITDRG